MKGTRLIRLLRRTGTGQRKLDVAVAVVEKNPNATGQEVYDALYAHAKEHQDYGFEGTIRKAEEILRTGTYRRETFVQRHPEDVIEGVFPGDEEEDEEGEDTTDLDTFGNPGPKRQTNDGPVVTSGEEGQTDAPQTARVPAAKPKPGLPKSPAAPLGTGAATKPATPAGAPKPIPELKSSNTATAEAKAGDGVGPKATGTGPTVPPADAK